MLITATPRNDGAVILTAPTPANYEVYRSADGVNYVKIGDIVNGTVYKDLRPHMNWQYLGTADAVLGGTWGVNEYVDYTFTGRRIGIRGSKYGDGTDPRGKVMAAIYENGVVIDSADLSTPHNTDPDAGGNEYDGMMLWGKNYKSVVTKTIRIQRTYSARPSEWGVNVSGYWVETGEQVIEFGQQGYYKFKDKATGLFSTLVAVTPVFDYAARLNDLFNYVLDFQLSQPNQVIDVTPARSTPYLMWKALPFAWAYMVTKDTKYKDAADRQFTLAQTLKYNGNICFDLPGVSSYYGMPDYNARHANSAYWAYKIFGDAKYLREAEQVADAARRTYAVYSYRGFSPVCYNYAVQDWFSSIGCMFAQLWADPDSIYYHSTTYLNLAKASLGCWLTFQNPTTGEIEMNRDTGISAFPDGVYTQFALTNAYVANAVLRNTDGSPVMPELEAGLAKAHKWEIKYSFEPFNMYMAIYHEIGGPCGSRAMSAYEETKAGRYTLEDWLAYYREVIGPVGYATADTALANGVPSYWPSGMEVADPAWYSKNTINMAFGPVMSYAAGVPEEWYNFTGVPDTDIVEEPAYFGGPFGGYFGQEVVPAAIPLQGTAYSNSDCSAILGVVHTTPVLLQGTAYSASDCSAVLSVGASRSLPLQGTAYSASDCSAVMSVTKAIPLQATGYSYSDANAVLNVQKVAVNLALQGTAYSYSDATAWLIVNRGIVVNLAADAYSYSDATADLRIRILVDAGAEALHSSIAEARLLVRKRGKRKNVYYRALELPTWYSVRNPVIDDEGGRLMSYEFACGSRRDVIKSIEPHILDDVIAGTYVLYDPSGEDIDHGELSVDGGVVFATAVIPENAEGIYVMVFTISITPADVEKNPQELVETILITAKDPKKAA